MTVVEAPRFKFLSRMDQGARIQQRRRIRDTSTTESKGPTNKGVALAYHSGERLRIRVIVVRMRCQKYVDIEIFGLNKQ